jgi:hypothetical protein
LFGALDPVPPRNPHHDHDGDNDGDNDHGH